MIDGFYFVRMCACVCVCVFVELERRGDHTKKSSPFQSDDLDERCRWREREGGGETTDGSFLFLLLLSCACVCVCDWSRKSISSSCSSVCVEEPVKLILCMFNVIDYTTTADEWKIMKDSFCGTFFFPDKNMEDRTKMTTKARLRNSKN